MKKLLRTIALHVSTFGPLGYLPAPGTWGSLSALPLIVWFSRYMMTYEMQTIVIMLLILAVYGIITYALPVLPPKYDPQEVILDEVLGMFIVFMGMPLTPMTLLLGFLYFRIFDIFKPLGIDYLQALPGAVGIVADDIVAGIFAHLALTVTLSLTGL